MSQKTYFKLIALLGLVFIPIRSLLAIAPHKTGLQYALATEPEWNLGAILGILAAAILGGYLLWNMVKANHAQKSQRYDQ
jgi:uncharacterized integral membrane protein